MESLLLRLKEATELLEDLEENGLERYTYKKTAQIKRTLLDIRKMSISTGCYEDRKRWEQIYRNKNTEK